MPQRKHYTKQFKEEALRLVSQEGVSLTQVARDAKTITDPILKEVVEFLPEA